MGDKQFVEEQGRILVVDDYPINRLKLSHLLEKQGHAVALAEDGQQALELLRAELFDVVLLDIVMPEMDGFEVLSEMKRDAQLRDIPVIVVSAIDEVDSAVRCIEMGAEDYLPKPFNPVFLEARLKASLRRKKLRDLEQAYLQQEIMLRQNEKLATLGKLSAGMAHELNNPAAAVTRGAEQLRAAVIQHLNVHLNLSETNLTMEQVSILRELGQSAREQANQASTLDAISRSDHETALEAWLHENGIDSGWELAPALTSLGYDPEALTRLASHFTQHQRSDVLNWLVSCFTVHSLLREIGEGAGRMSQIVRALKTYSYLDQAPVQNVNVHEGLDNTLVMLRSKLKQGVTVHRHYAADLPLIEAYGSELNQVWTNIIDNAVDAMGGRGELTLRTWQDSEGVVVEIEDNGPGIPDTIQGQIFDPFFTTKPPGEGTGLGLNITHTIIVQKHKGTINVTSRPGRTCFRITLPHTIP